MEVSAWIHHERNIFINNSSLKCSPELVLILLLINKSRKKCFGIPKSCINFCVKHRSVKKVISLSLLQKLPKLSCYISPFFLVMYRPLQIQYSQIAKAALRFIIPWSSLNKGPKFIPGIRALLSLNWDAGHLFWESCETLTCKPLVWNNPMSRTSDSSWSPQSVQWDPLPSKHL